MSARVMARVGFSHGRVLQSSGVQPSFMRSSALLSLAKHGRKAVGSGRTFASKAAGASALKPDEVVAALDKHIVGQSDAKVATAIALRDQWRRQQLSAELQGEVLPNNILMVGPTGVGKTEVARRLAKLAHAPFVKVEATKFTEVGIYGQDTESMIVDLVDAAAQQVEEQAREAARPAARERAIESLVAAIGWKDESERESIRSMLRDDQMGDTFVEMAMPHKRGGGGGGNFGGLASLFGRGRAPGGSPGPAMGVPSFAIGMPKELADALRNASIGGAKGMRFGGFGGPDDDGTEGSETKERLRVREALPRLLEAEIESSMMDVDLDALAVEQAQERGIVFVDEIDKLVRRADGGLGGGGSGGGALGAKGEGVQKELLALLEGTHVRTPRGLVSTRHILFICAGAFHQAKPADLLPELQGRLPVRVELKALTEADFVRILSDTTFNLLVQQTKLMETEGVTLTFTPGAIQEIARLAALVNSTVENIGARRLRTVVSKLMEEVSFNAHRLSGTTVEVTAEYVHAHTGEMAAKVDVHKYIL